VRNSSLGRILSHLPDSVQSRSDVFLLISRNELLVLPSSLPEILVEGQVSHFHIHSPEERMLCVDPTTIKTNIDFLAQEL